MKTNQSNHSFVRFLGNSGTSLLRLLPAEFAHSVGLGLIKSGIMGNLVPPQPARRMGSMNLTTFLPALGELKHPIGLAAGFDKNCQCLQGLAGLGFSWIEGGAVTPRLQDGHPKPRLFRLKEQQALVNRMGFNNIGVEGVVKELESIQSATLSVPFGINVGINKTTPKEQAANDYVMVIKRLNNVVPYFSINISSPNTSNLKSLVRKDFLKSLSSHLESESIDLNKIYIKLAPDLEKKIFQQIIEVISDIGFAGVVLCNTKSIEQPYKGGLSGRPLFCPANTCLEWAWEVNQGQLPTIGVGGVMSGKDAFQKIIRGASAVQIYTSFIYRGPFVVSYLLEELSSILKVYNFSSIEEARGSYYKKGIK